MYYGEPRLTRDVDVIVRLRPDDLPAFAARFSPDEFSLDEQSARQAVDTSGQFNYELLYSRHVASDLHLRDVVGILRVSGAELDEAYVTEWARRLGMAALWERIRTQVE